MVIYGLTGQQAEVSSETIDKRTLCHFDYAVSLEHTKHPLHLDHRSYMLSLSNEALFFRHRKTSYIRQN